MPDRPPLYGIFWGIFFAHMGGGGDASTRPETHARPKQQHVSSDSQVSLEVRPQSDKQLTAKIASQRFSAMQGHDAKTLATLSRDASHLKDLHVTRFIQGKATHPKNHPPK